MQLIAIACAAVQAHMPAQCAAASARASQSSRMDGIGAKSGRVRMMITAGGELQILLIVALSATQDAYIRVREESKFVLETVGTKGTEKGPAPEETTATIWCMRQGIESCSNANEDNSRRVDASTNAASYKILSQICDEGRRGCSGR